jgi:hypothetical protein
MTRAPLPKESNALQGYSKEVDLASHQGNLQLGIAKLKRTYTEGDGKLDVKRIMDCVADDGWLKENDPSHKFKTGIGQIELQDLIAANLAWLKYTEDPKSISVAERESIEKFATHAADFIVMGKKKDKPIEIVFPE